MQVFNPLVGLGDWWTPPVDKLEIMRPFGASWIPHYLLGHAEVMRGDRYPATDIAVKRGASVRAPCYGRVRKIDALAKVTQPAQPGQVVSATSWTSDSPLGISVVLDQEADLKHQPVRVTHMLCHMGVPTIRKGQQVEPGQVIGLAGSSGWEHVRGGTRALLEQPMLTWVTALSDEQSSITTRRILFRFNSLPASVQVHPSVATIFRYWVETGDHQGMVDFLESFERRLEDHTIANVMEEWLDDAEKAVKPSSVLPWVFTGLGIGGTLYGLAWFMKQGARRGKHG